MKFILLVSAISTFVRETWGDGNFTFTYSMASRCKEHICRHGYVYDTFYQIDEGNLKHATVKLDNTTISYFEMHIAIQAPSNGHILLSSTQKPGLRDPVYEIVIGGGGNKFTELRLNQKTNARSSAKTPGILSAIDFTAFYIRISDDGLVEFGKEGDNVPVLRYYDAHTLPIKYFSFASWTGVEAKFLYDCPDPTSNDAKTPDSQVVLPKFSKSDELKRSLLLSKLPWIPPSPSSVQVQLGIRVIHVKFDAVESKMTSRVAVIMSWTDDSMSWNPVKYNGTSSLKFRQGQIWRPKFFVFNSDSTDPFDTLNPDLIFVVNSGESIFHFQAEVNTFCTNSDDNVHKWPNDEYTCAIVIEPWEVHEKISVEIMDPHDSKFGVFAHIDQVIQSEWEMSYTQRVYKPHVWNNIYSHIDNQTHQSDRLVINVDLIRRPGTANIAFYTPLLVLLCFVLMSFWGEQLQMSRVWFYAGCAIVTCLCLCSINFIVPTYTLPTIVILYIATLYGVLLALLIQALLMTSMAEKLCRTRFMQTMLTYPMLRTVFCLQPIKISLNGEYSRQENETELDVQEPERSRNDRADLALMIDNTMFVVYSVTAVVMLAHH